VIINTPVKAIKIENKINRDNGVRRNKRLKPYVQKVAVA
jgi:hypothetical protein